MTNSNLTGIIAILDRSGSMGSLREQTIDGFNGFVKEQQEALGEAWLTLVQFNDEYQIDYEGRNVREVPPLTAQTYQPRAGTALYDAVGRAIKTTGDRLASLAPSERPGQVIVLIITDGHENASTDYTQAAVREMVKHQTDQYNWRFVFMGGGNLEQQKAQGAGLGVVPSNVYGYGNNTEGSHALWNSATSGVVRSRGLQSKGVVLNATDSLLTDSERGALESTAN